MNLFFIGNFRGSAQQFREKYIERTRVEQEKIKFLLNTSSRDVWKCDPRQYSIGTYGEVTNFLQGYIENEINLNEENSCKRSCSDYQIAELSLCNNETLCPHIPTRDRSICRGRIVNCDFVGSDLNICKSVSLTFMFSIRKIKLKFSIII